ncbi:hypothetical protein QTO17_00765 [Vibrio owensii]
MINSNATTFGIFTNEVARLLGERFGLNLNDIDTDSLQTSFNEGESVDDFVSWVGNKFDLTEYDDLLCY